jgi:hypothetical protein
MTRRSKRHQRTQSHRERYSTKKSWFSLVFYGFTLAILLLFYNEVSSGMAGCMGSLQKEEEPISTPQEEAPLFDVKIPAEQMPTSGKREEGFDPEHGILNNPVQKNDQNGDQGHIKSKPGTDIVIPPSPPEKESESPRRQ